jgi:hypothetical protein
VRVLEGALAPGFEAGTGLLAPPLSFSGFGREVLKETRTRLVERVEVAGTTVYRKVYSYPNLRDLASGVFRTTLFAPSRPEREWRSLGWLAGRGLQRELRVAMAERRTFGFLREAVLVTAEFVGEPLDHWLSRAAAADRERILEALWDWVARVHETGHRDRNLDARNVLVRVDGDRVEFAKIDSPESFRVRDGTRMDRWRREDLRRLKEQVEPAAEASSG